jgi:structural maintenance of chromosome 4
MCRIQKEGIDAGLLQMALAVEPLDEANVLSSCKEKIALLEAQLKELKPNLDVITEYILLSTYSYVLSSFHVRLTGKSNTIFVHTARYRQKAAVYDERVKELTEVTQEKDDLKKIHDDLRKKR